MQISSFHRVTLITIYLIKAVSPKAKDLLRSLLTRDPEKRLGANGADEIKKDPFFADVNWDILLAKKYQTPFKPNVVNIN